MKHCNTFIISGLVICKETPFLASSPDGLLITDKNEILTVEVKCPKTCENGPIVDVDYLKNGHGNELNESRRAKEIYTQMQYQMYFCKVNRGVLFVFTSMDQRKIPVSLNLDFI